jgi:hypothetical protein
LKERADRMAYSITEIGKDTFSHLMNLIILKPHPYFFLWREKITHAPFYVLLVGSMLAHTGQGPFIKRPLDRSANKQPTQ